RKESGQRRPRRLPGHADGRIAGTLFQKCLKIIAITCRQGDPLWKQSGGPVFRRCGIAADRSQPITAAGKVGLTRNEHTVGWILIGTQPEFSVIITGEEEIVIPGKVGEQVSRYLL